MTDKKNHPEVKYGKTGVLLVNLGTPDSTKWFDVRRYLKEFLSSSSPNPPVPLYGPKAIFDMQVVKVTPSLQVILSC